MSAFVPFESDLTETASLPSETAVAGPSVYIRTYGCQMNVSDSQTIESLLNEAGYSFANSPDEADVVLINTCAVREHAETRALGQLADLARLKKTKPHTVIGILGCVAQARRREILDAMPYVDIVVGPDAYRKLPALLEERLISPPGTPGLLETALVREELYDEVVPRHHGGVTAFVTIIRGCDKFCSFCIVPRTRGRERSRPLPSILREVEALVGQGVREVMLLGQNVDSYRWEDRVFADCLSAVAKVDGLARVRYMTSHPSDISEQLLDVMAGEPKICPFLHLPAQAGSDRILERMNRPYTREHYLKIIAVARKRMPELALSTDLIVGFPAETEEDFEQTLELVREVRYDTAFTFKYSARPGTKAARLDDDVPDAVKIERLERLNTLQKRISRERNLEQLGKRTEILVEGEAPKDSAMWMGRTPDYRPVVIAKNGDRIGDVSLVRLTELVGFTFRAERLLRVQ
ncbi:tRNA (N6-isopentenyl adenosine(37)-C2)-methylthiotransferase MiaB [bacterium]|nr:tRNA (N6-isopentenyl adenosine(37)-C2)-methylthiotransferase MiaB [bacterium]MBU1985531.1 tRNA (N6-isopentenyl adenosine(37)-C2)-methylthiotransferase MiaB [bacterium]